MFERGHWATWTLNWQSNLLLIAMGVVLLFDAWETAILLISFFKRGHRVDSKG
ncbi:MAG: hypothetical protein ACJAQT_003331 [Akkermansiaceae bacterium]|jgi:hypothetical protein